MSRLTTVLALVIATLGIVQANSAQMSGKLYNLPDPVDGTIQQIANEPIGIEVFEAPGGLASGVDGNQIRIVSSEPVDADGRLIVRDGTFDFTIPGSGRRSVNIRFIRNNSAGTISAETQRLRAIVIDDNDTHRIDVTVPRPSGIQGGCFYYAPWSHQCEISCWRVAGWW